MYGQISDYIIEDRPIGEIPLHSIISTRRAMIDNNINESNSHRSPQHFNKKTCDERIVHDVNTYNNTSS